MHRQVYLSVVLTLFLFSCGSPEEEGTCGPLRGTVQRIVDGDTILLTTGERIRYLGIDAPESYACYGPEATSFNEALVLGKEVTLEYDQECYDRYGRLLAYVYLDGGSVNLTLLEQGLACTMFIEPNTRYQKIYEETMQVARAWARGVWSACDPVPCL